MLCSTYCYLQCRLLLQISDVMCYFISYGCIPLWGSPMLSICSDELLIMPPSKLNPWERSELVCYSIYQKRRGQFLRDNMSIIMMINLIAGEIHSMQRTSTVCSEYTSPTKHKKDLPECETEKILLRKLLPDVPKTSCHLKLMHRQLCSSG